MNNLDEVNFEKIYEKIFRSKKRLGLSTFTEMLIETLKLIERSRYEFHLSEDDFDNLGATLTASLCLSMLTYKISREEAIELVKECGIENPKFVKDAEKSQSAKEKAKA